MAETHDPSDEDLIARARSGDERAFTTLVRRYEGQVAATVIGMLGPGPEADDVGQETFIRFYNHMDQFRGEARLGTYLTRIAINQSLKALRKRKRRFSRLFSRDNEEVKIDEPSTDGDDALEGRERAALVYKALQHLSDKHRAVVVLRMLEGYSTKETARILDIPEGTVMSRLYRAMDQLEDRLGPLLSTDAVS